MERSPGRSKNEKILRFLNEVISRHGKLSKRVSGFYKLDSVSKNTVESDFQSLLDFIHKYEIGSNYSKNLFFSGDVHRANFRGGAFSKPIKERFHSFGNAWSNHLFQINEEFGFAFESETESRPPLDTQIGIDEEFTEEIRKIVHRARALISQHDIPGSLRTSLLKQFSEIERDVERGRTAFHAIMESFVDLSYATREGLQNLEPIIGQLKELAAAFRRREIVLKVEYEEPKALPRPSDTKADADIDEKL